MATKKAAKKSAGKKAAPRNIPTQQIVVDHQQGIVRVAGEPDRVWCSASLKTVIGNDQYGPRGEAGAGMSSSVREGETPADAFERIWSDTGDFLSQRIKELKHGK